MSYKEKIICPQCSTIYLVDREKVPTDNRKSAKCAKCQSRFYVEKRRRLKNQVPEEERTPFIVSYFEKRFGADRRRGTDRRREIDTNSFPFPVPLSKDIIPFFDKEGVPVGYNSEGLRNGKDRRNGEDRRAFLNA
jgi:predicted Zn finger-like uncharacterized protein